MAECRQYPLAENVSEAALSNYNRIPGSQNRPLPEYSPLLPCCSLIIFFCSLAAPSCSLAAPSRAGLKQICSFSRTEAAFGEIIIKIRLYTDRCRLDGNILIRVGEASRRL